MRRGKQVHSRRGFTLLEILVVIAIIALLAAFVVPELMGVREESEIKVARQMVDPGGTLGQVLERYRLNMRTYPESLEDLTTPPEDEEEKARWGTKPYIRDAEKLKDPWGEELNYKFPGDVSGDDMYDLWSSGPNRENEDGDGDDITSWKKED